MAQILFSISLVSMAGMLFLKSFEIKNKKELFDSKNLKKVALSVENWFSFSIKSISRFDRPKIKSLTFDFMFWLKESYAKIQDITHKKVSSMSRANVVVPDVEDRKESSVYLKDVSDYKRKLREEENIVSPDEIEGMRREVLNETLNDRS